jgi:hypothetical protein
VPKKSAKQATAMRKRSGLSLPGGLTGLIVDRLAIGAQDSREGTPQVSKLWIEGNVCVFFQPAGVMSVERE